MPTILDRVPIPEKDDVTYVGTEMVRVKAYEILVWVSLTPKHPPSDWQPGTRRFPAVLDSAHTHNFSLQAQHLTRWSGLTPQRLRPLGRLRKAGLESPLYAANVWIYFNQPGERDALRECPPYRLELPRGIAVHPDESSFPRVPVLGLRALITNRLHLTVDGEHRFASLRTPRRFWLFD
jgi:hypothetical protein